MIDDYFYDLDGTPLTGKVPIQVRVIGEGDLGPARAAANNALHAFLTNVRLSLGQSHVRRYRLPGAIMAVRSIFGVVSVELFPTKKKLEKPPFYGGILLKLKVFEDEEAYLNDATYGLGGTFPSGWPKRYDLRQTPSVIQFGDPGRPAVPGTLETDRTEWLIFQIDRSAPLDDGPVTSGAIKITRIHNPLVGKDACEIDEREDEYLISAEASFPEGSSDHLRFGLGEFYLCGKKMLNVPRLEFGISQADAPMLWKDAKDKLIRLVTVDKRIDSFEDAATAEAVIIVAVFGKLFAINTAARGSGDAEWVLLNSVPFDRDGANEMNYYGATVTRTASPNGGTIVTCSGSNGAGVCSGFEITYTKNINNRGADSISGVLYLMTAPQPEPVGEVQTRTINISTSASYVNSVVSGYDWDPLKDPSLWDYTSSIRHVSPWTYSRADYSFYRNFDPASPRPLDKLSGEPLPFTEVCYELEVDIDYFSTGSLTNPLSDSDVHPHVPGTPLSDFPWFTNVASATEFGEVTRRVLAGGRLGLDRNYSMTTGGSSTTGGHPDMPPVYEAIPAWTMPSDSATLVFGEEPRGAKNYTAIDDHSKVMAFVSDRGHTGTFIASGGSQRAEFDALRHSYMLRRMPQGEIIYEWVHFPAAFTTVSPSIFGPQALYASWSNGVPVVPYTSEGIELPNDSPIGNRLLVWGGAVPPLANFSGVGAPVVSGAPGGSGGPKYPNWWKQFSLLPPQLPTNFSPAATSWPVEPEDLSFSYTFDPNAALVEMTRADYVSTNKLSDLYLWHHYYTTDGFNYYPPSSQESRDAEDALQPQRIVIGGTGPFKGGTGEIFIPGPNYVLAVIDDRIHRDLRTGGYIAQSYWRARDADPRWLDSDPAVRRWPVRLETIIGNDWGAVPLQDVLNEWRLLGDLTHPDIPTMPEGEFSRVVIQGDIGGGADGPLITETPRVSLL